MKIVGHRGAKGLAPENTLASIKAALAAGADLVEFDVRVTRDGVPVLNHDSFLQIEGSINTIGRSDFSELRRDYPDMLTLQQALTAIRGRAVPMIEVKTGEPVEPVVRVIRKFIDERSMSRAYEPDGIIIGSKSQKTLVGLHDLLPGVPTVVIEPWSGVRAVWRARRIGTKYISMRSWWLYESFLRAMHQRGYKLFVYTINNREHVRRWQYFIHGIITDYPDRFRR